MMAKLIAQLTSAIRLVTEYPQGLSMLLGTVPPPGCEEIGEMLDCVRCPSEPTLDPAGYPIRVCGGRVFIEADTRIDNAEIFDRVIERAGGWAHINKVVAEWRKHYPRKWAIVADYVTWVKGNFKNIDGSQLDYVANRYGVGRNTVSKEAQCFPQRMATAILNAPDEKPFRLEDINELKAVS
jgi:hypothetical protein